MKTLYLRFLTMLFGLLFFLPSKSYSQSLEVNASIENFLFKAGDVYQPAIGTRIHLQQEALQYKGIWLGVELGFFSHAPVADKVVEENYSIEYLNNLLHFPLAFTFGRHYSKNDKLFYFWQSGLSYNYIFNGKVEIRSPTSNSGTGYSDTRTGPHLGGGITYQLNPSIALNGQFRYALLWTPPASGQTASGAVVTALESSDLAGDFIQTLSLDIGIKILFGNK